MKTKAWKHQREAFELSKDLPAFALLFEQRTGKTRVTLETAHHLFTSGKIDGMVIIAPNGVHTNWLRDEFPTHWPDATPYQALVWKASKAATLTAKREAAALLEYRSGLAVLALNAEGLITEAAKAYLKKFLTTRKCLFVCDESDVFAHPGAKRTMVALAASKYAAYRRILTGTPVAESPLDAYAQFKILDPTILGHTSFTSFKARYAEYEEGYDPRTGRRFPKLLGYRNLPELQANMARFSSRVTRAEVSDAPPKVYQKRYFSLSLVQRRVYDELREKFVVDLSAGGVITAANVLARYTRLQQIASNIAVADLEAQECQACHATDPECPVCEGLGVVVPERLDREVDPEHNPRLDALMEDITTSRPDSSIVWAKFNYDIDAILTALKKAGRNPTRYDGQVSSDEREAAKAAFRSGEATDFVGKTSSGGRGLDLSRASTVYFYSHSFPLRLRLQGEDRGEGLRKTFGTQIVDLIAEDTIDMKVVEALRAKRNISDLITGDDPSEWI